MSRWLLIILQNYDWYDRDHPIILLFDTIHIYTGVGQHPVPMVNMEKGQLLVLDVHLKKRELQVYWPKKRHVLYQLQYFPFFLVQYPIFGWWFGTYFFLFHSVGNNHHSNWRVSFRRVETTNQILYHTWGCRPRILFSIVKTFFRLPTCGSYSNRMNSPLACTS